jgi:hypothetical protein
VCCVPGDLETGIGIIRIEGRERRADMVELEPPLPSLIPPDARRTTEPAVSFLPQLRGTQVLVEGSDPQLHPFKEEIPPVVPEGLGDVVPEPS